MTEVVVRMDKYGFPDKVVVCRDRAHAEREVAAQLAEANKKEMARSRDERQIWSDSGRESMHSWLIMRDGETYVTG